MMLGLSLYIMFWLVEGWNGLDEFHRLNLPEFSFMLDDQDEHVQHIGSCPDFCWDKNQRAEVTKRNRWQIAVAPPLMDVVGKIHGPEIQDHCHLLPGSGRAVRTGYSSRSSRGLPSQINQCRCWIFWLTGWCLGFRWLRWLGMFHMTLL